MLFKQLASRIAATNRNALANQKTSGTGAGFLGRATVTRSPVNQALQSNPRLYKTRRLPVARQRGAWFSQLINFFKG